MPDKPENGNFIVDLRTGRKPYQPVTVVLAAAGAVNAAQEIVGDFRFLSINSATYPDDVQISWDGGQNYGMFPVGITSANFYGTSFWIKNTNVAANTVVLFKGEGSYTDNRILLAALSAIPISLASGSVASGAFASGALAAGSIAAGALAAGSIAAGAAVAGSFLTGAIVDLGLKADAAATTDAGTFSLIALTKRLLGKLDPLVNSVYTVDSLGTTNLAQIKASAGRIKSIDAVNCTGAIKVLRFYDVLGAGVTVGATVATRVYAIAANSSLHIDFGSGDTYATAISVAITGAIAYNDATAVAAHDVQLAVNYQ